MKIKGQKSDMVKTVGNVQNVAGIKSALPILSNILIEATKEKVRFTATDLEVGIVATAQIEVLEEGATTIPAKKFFEIIRELPEGEVTITTKKNNATHIECGKTFFKIPGLPKEEFPKLPEFHNKEVLTLEQKTLKEMLVKTIFAVSHDDARYVLNGALFAIQPKKLTIVATDGRRLALIERETQNHGPFEKRAIVPIKAAQELVKNLKDEGQIKVAFSDTQVLFELENLVIISRLIEGEFPSYEEVIPHELKEKISTRRENLLQATKRVSLLATQDSQAVKFDLLKDKLVISKNSPEAGEAREELDAEYKGPELSVGFNPNYITDVLKNLNDEEVKIELSSPEKPGVIRTQDKYIYLILPMQLG